MHRKRKEIYDVIVNLINKKYPENACRIPHLKFVMDDGVAQQAEDAYTETSVEPMEVDREASCDAVSSNVPDKSVVSLPQNVLHQLGDSTYHQADCGDNTAPMGPPLAKKIKSI
jgi:hypothetical protein